MLGNVEDARDVVQEAFLRLWESGKWQSEGLDLKPLLTKILVNRCIDILRKRAVLRFFRLTQKQSDQLKKADSTVESDFAKKEFQERVLDAAEKLKPRQKAVFTLRDIEGFSVKETAEILQCKENNVLVNLHHARRNLRKELSKYFNE